MLESELIPAREKGSGRLMVMLHGLGDSMEGYRWFPEAMRLPWLNYLLVNAPDEYYGGYSWYSFAGDLAPGVARSRELLFELLDSQRSEGYATEKTVLGGFSQGCLMSIDVGLRYPHHLAGIFGISGYVCEPEKLVKEMSSVGREQKLLVTHGTRDPLIPIEGVRKQIQFLKQAGVQIEWREFVKEHTIAGEEEIMLIRDFVQMRFPSGGD
jgi:phospholipase/carboxylesterase